MKKLLLVAFLSAGLIGFLWASDYTGSTTPANEDNVEALLKKIAKSLNVGGSGATGIAGTLVNSSAYEASHVLKNGSGTLISLVGYNSKASAQFIQIYNSATVPADAAIPIYTFTVPATSNFSLDIPITGAPFTTGISVSNSSTGPTKTIGSADCWFTAVVR